MLSGGSVSSPAAPDNIGLLPRLAFLLAVVAEPRKGCSDRPPQPHNPKKKKSTSLTEFKPNSNRLLTICTFTSSGPDDYNISGDRGPESDGTDLRSTTKKSRIEKWL